MLFQVILIERRVTFEYGDSSARGYGNLVRIEKESKDDVYAKVRTNVKEPIFVVITFDLVSH
jgi:hypothetical protein